MDSVKLKMEFARWFIPEVVKNFQGPKEISLKGEISFACHKLFKF